MSINRAINENRVESMYKINNKLKSKSKSNAMFCENKKKINNNNHINSSSSSGSSSSFVERMWLLCVLLTLYGALHVPIMFIFVLVV